MSVSSVHAYDVIVKGERRWHVAERTFRAGMVVLVTQEDGCDYSKPWTLDCAYLVTVLVEHDCQCAGSGLYYSGGGVENGVYTGKTGPCFGCHGKGWQSRADVIRNQTYWNKYARISA